MASWERYDDINERYAEEVAKYVEVESDSASQPEENEPDQLEAFDQAEEVASIGAMEKQPENHDPLSKAPTIEYEEVIENDRRLGQYQKQKPEKEGKDPVSQQSHLEASPWAQHHREDEETKGGAPNKVEQGHENGKGQELGTPPIWTTENTFKSLMYFFEAIALERLKSTRSAGSRLPNEIYELILGYVTDMESYNACMMVSRDFRNLCQQRPLIMDNVVLLKKLHSPNTPDKNSQVSRKVHEQPAFRMLECTSSRTMDVSIDYGYRSSHDGLCACLMVTGSESNRKAFPAHCQIIFQGLALPALQIEKLSRSGSIDWRRPAECKYGLTSHVLDAVFEDNPITARSTTDDLCDLWETAIKSVFDDPHEWIYTDSIVKGWDMPPNTKQLYAGSGGWTNEDFSRLLVIRIKRASRYWDGLWDNILCEATDNMNTPESKSNVKTNDPRDMHRQVVGADDPCVMLIIGIEVRLFQWKQGFDEGVQGRARKGLSPYGKLEEFLPGKTYVIDKAEDREVVEAFLRTVAKRRVSSRKIYTAEGGS